MNYDEIIIQRSVVFKPMLWTFIFVRYSRRTSNYLERVILSDPTHVMSMVDPITICVDILKINSGVFLEKELT